MSQLGEFTFRFVTDQNIHYTVGFYKDTIFMDDGAYHFFIENTEHEHGSYDSKILDVVTVILEEFFSQEPTASKNIAKNCNVSDSLGHISLDFFDYDRIISLDFFNSYQIICLDYFFFVYLQRENS